MKIIGIVGSRRRDSVKDLEICIREFKKIYQEGDRIVSGGCKKGGDAFAEVIARGVGCTIIIHHANWKKFGKSAGFERNTRIAEDCNVLIALVAEDRTGGTEDTVRKVLEFEKEVIYC